MDPQKQVLSEDFIEATCPVTGARVHSSHQWTDIHLTRDYSITFHLINDNILSAYPRGIISYEGTCELFKHYDQFLNATGLANGSFIEISDYGRITNIPSKRTRIKVLGLLEEKINKDHLEGHFVYNVPKHIKWMYNIGTHLKRPNIPMEALNNYAAAIQKALKTQTQKSKKTSFFQTVLNNLSRKKSQGQPEELLEYIGAINWDEPGIPLENIPESHPYKVVFDAISVLKTDIDQTFNQGRKIEEKYKSLFNHISDPILVFDQKDLNILDCNQAFLNIYGYTRKELALMTPHDLHPEEELKKVNENINKKTAGPRRYTHITKNGKSMDVEIKTDETEYHGRGAWISNIRDITETNKLENELRKHRDSLGSLVEEKTRALKEEIAERKQTERQLRDAKAQAESATKTKSQFLANMSHEIRTPMNGILGMVELIMETPLDHNQKSLAATIDKEATSLLEIINSILDFSKIEAGKMELELRSFNLRLLFEDTAATVAITAQKKGLELISFLPPGIPEQLIGDSGRLRQILMNLMGNAVKFTHEGKIFIWVEPMEQRKEEVKDQITLKFNVKDTGIGIPREKQETIFESFAQADGSTTRKYGGTGLGTTISKQLVRLMGGNIGLDSKPSHGSTFWFTANFKADHTQAQVSTPVLDTGLKDKNLLIVDNNNRFVLLEEERKKIRILLVEDYPTNQKVAMRHLTSLGYQVSLAEDGQQAVDQFKTGTFHLVLMDIQMPVMDGYKATQLIREHERKSAQAFVQKNPGQAHKVFRTPIIAMTAHAIKGYRKKCLAAGLDDFVTKPLRKKDFIALIDSHTRVN